MIARHDCFQITQKVFIRKGDQFLVMRDKRTSYGDLPGGRMNEVEFFSDWLASVNRELIEELGKDVKLKIDPKPLFVHRHRVNDENFPCIIIAYKAEYITGEILISDEHDYLEWVSIHTFKPEILFSEYMLEAVNLYLSEFA